MPGTTRMATPDCITGPQRKYILSLADSRDLGEMRALVLEKANSEHTLRREASRMIDLLKTLPYLPKDQPALPGTDQPTRESFVLEDGMYMLDRAIYKVQHAIHGSGKQYAKRLEMIEPDCGGCANGETESCIDLHGKSCEWTASFEYAPGMIRKLRPEHRMTKEEAKAFGATYGTCANCGRTLTDERSIERGFGPVCAKKFL